MRTVFKGAFDTKTELVFPVNEGKKRNWWEQDREKGKSTLVPYQCPSE